MNSTAPDALRMEVMMLKHRRVLSAAHFLVILTWLGIVFLSRCSFKLPTEAPTWDVNLIIPLVSKMYTVEELIEDTDDLVIDYQNETIIFSMEEEIDRFEVGEHLKIDGAGSSVTIQVPQGIPVGQEYDQSGEVVFPGDIVIENAVVKSGEIIVEITNQSGYQGRIELEIPSITFGGNSVRIEIVSTPGINPPRHLDLSAYTITPRNVGGRSRIDFNTKVIIEAVHGGQAGNFQISFNISDIFFEEVTGTLNEIEVPFDSAEMEIDFPEELEGFEIGSAELELTLRVGVRIPMHLNLIIQGFETNGPSAAPVQIDTWMTPTPSGEINIFLPDIAGLINSQPARVLISGSIEVGDGTTQATVYDTTSIQGSFLFRAPLIFSLPEYHTTLDDVDTLEIDEDTREAVRDNLYELTVVADIENHLPIGGSVYIMFSRTLGDTSLYDDPDLTIGPVTFAKATLSNDDPKVVAQPGTDRLKQILTKDEHLVLFEEDELYWGIKFDFQGTPQGALAKLRPSDYIHVRAHGSVTVRTKIPEDDDKEGGGS